MEKPTCIYYKDLTLKEKELVNSIERQSMRKKREDFIKDERYKGCNPEDVWYLKNDYIDNWVYPDNYLFTKCSCGSLEFKCISDNPSSYQSRKCIFVCLNCGSKHIEYN